MVIVQPLLLTWSEQLLIYELPAHRDHCGMLESEIWLVSKLVGGFHLFR